VEKAVAHACWQAKALRLKPETCRVLKFIQLPLWAKGCHFQRHIIGNVQAFMAQGESPCSDLQLMGMQMEWSERCGDGVVHVGLSD